MDSLTSQHLQDCFIKRKIDPKETFAMFYSDEKPYIALSYQWRQPFSEILRYFSDTNVFNYNRTHQGETCPIPTVRRNDAENSDWDKDLDPELREVTVWIDIFFNDQLMDKVAMKAVLAKSEGVYKEAPLHLVLYDDGLFKRCWCLAEMVFRAEADRTSGLLLLATGEEECAVELEQAKWDYYWQMEASVAADLALIRERIDVVYQGDREAFNQRVHRLRKELMARLARSTPVDDCLDLLRRLARLVVENQVGVHHRDPDKVNKIDVQRYLIRERVDLRVEFGKYFSRAPPVLYVTSPHTLGFGAMEGFFAPQSIADYNQRFAGHDRIPDERRRVTICLDWMFQPYHVYESYAQLECTSAFDNLDGQEDNRKLREAPVHCGLAHADLLEVGGSQFCIHLCERRRARGKTGLLESARVQLPDDPALRIRLGPAAPPPFHDHEAFGQEYRDVLERKMVEAFGSVGACRAAVDEMRRRLGPPLP